MHSLQQEVGESPTTLPKATERLRKESDKVAQDKRHCWEVVFLQEYAGNTRFYRLLPTFTVRKTGS